MVSINNFPQAQKALADAEHIARQYLSPRQDGDIVIVRHTHDHYSWGGWHNCSPCYHSHDSCQSSRGSRDNSGFGALGLVSLITAAVMVYFVGAGIADCANSRGSLATLSKQKIDVTAEVKDPACFVKMNNVFAQEEQLLGHVDSQAQTSLALKITLLASATLTFVGCTLQAIAPVQMGLVGMAISAGTLLYQYGFDSRDSQLAQDARQLRHAVDDARLAFA